MGLFSKKEKVDFHTTSKINGFAYFDDENRQFAINKIKKENIYKYDDIVDFELLEDGDVVSSGGIGRALVGGALFGGAGAVVGAVTSKKKQTCNNMKVKITVKNNDTAAIYINLIQMSVKKSGLVYEGATKSAQEILSKLQVICDERN